MSFSGVRVTKKHLKSLHKLQDLLDEARSNLLYCNDTTGAACGGSREEVEASKEATEGEFIGNITDMRDIVNDILKSYGDE
jgi:hypothetical protein